MIEIGQTVTWTSQAGGYSKTKAGKVLAIIEPEQEAYHRDFRFLTMPFRLIGVKEPVLDSRVKFDPCSSNRRVLVEVPRKSGTMDYYAPLLSVGEKQNEVSK